MIERVDWHRYFMNIAHEVASRATCPRKHVGAVVVRDKRLLSTGYNGSLRGLPHCDEVGHEMHTVTHEDGSTSRHCIRTAHSEQNAICEAARMGIALEGSTLYVKMSPCYTCAKMIINSGLKRVVCAQDYHTDGRSKEILKEAGVEYVLLSPEITKYEDQ